MSTRRPVQVGERFGYQVVCMEVEPNYKNGKRQFLMSCDCGKKHVNTLSDMVTGKSKSCGCWRRVFAFKHGHTTTSTAHKPSGHRGSPEYSAWVGLKQRCLNANNLRYCDYGGRGIKVCPQWIDNFTKFLADVGLRPSEGYSIDRINVNGDYEPSNVRWATRSEQQSNRRKYGHKERSKRDC